MTYMREETYIPVDLQLVIRFKCLNYGIHFSLINREPNRMMVQDI